MNKEILTTLAKQVTNIVEKHNSTRKHRMRYVEIAKVISTVPDAKLITCSQEITSVVTNENGSITNTGRVKLEAAVEGGGTETVFIPVEGTLEFGIEYGGKKVEVSGGTGASGDLVQPLPTVYWRIATQEEKANRPEFEAKGCVFKNNKIGVTKEMWDAEIAAKKAAKDEAEGKIQATPVKPEEPAAEVESKMEEVVTGTDVTAEFGKAKKERAKKKDKK